MAKIQGLKALCICLISIYLMIFGVAADSPKLGRSSFPKGFKFGAGSSAYQVEGAAHEGGRGPSVWDTFSHIPGKIEDGSNGDVAVDEYHRYKEDVQLLKHIGLDVYRFSISWSRIFPKGSPRHGGVNKEGIAYYNNLINELLKNGIEPFVTLFHWDTPQALEDEYGGFLSKRIVEDFGSFADQVFRAFGDRVKYWLTLNEPLVYTLFGYDLGTRAPGRCSSPFGNCTAGNSSTEPYIVAHHLILAHSAAVKIYRTKYRAQQKGSIGPALVLPWIVPYSNLDQQAAQRALDFRLGWFLDPLTFGKYPDSMRKLVGARLPRFTRKEAKDLRRSYDFLGYNYYVTQFAIDNPIPPNTQNTDYILDARANVTFEVNGTFIGSQEELNTSRSYPEGIYYAINYTKHHYNNPPVYITENGYAGFDNGTKSLKEALNDTQRVTYHYLHLSYLLKAIRDGADVRGYIVWALTDNFEWLRGFTGRFGLHYVDHKEHLKRYARASAYWFKHFLKT